ncbi:BON domain-containing protein [Azohydromonas caseinilytica]|uniref:BON domain-containing protein n=1 Tax=Azohydromonas caseinilytica TaxID=2728836 RepID=A0A848FCY9_9BURK|nr:BON domain-containing protein [Azohydromonas caseinilytica]NML17172.1 BON domain-containing protein [Azohydromonas caseinilytica]
MASLFKSVALAAFGAAAMYYLDPQTGPQRRAQALGKLNALSTGARGTGRGTLAQGRDVGEGSGAASSGAAQADRNRELRDRIYAEVGRLARQPDGIEVVVHEGNVSLRGEVVSDDERDRLLSTVLAMPGVLRIDNRLKAREEEPSSLAELAVSGGLAAAEDGAAPRPAGPPSIL